MGILDTLRGNTVATMTDTSVLEEQLQAERWTNEVLTESVTELELALEDQGWRRMTALGAVEFTRTGLERLVALCQLMAIKNPLIKRGLNLRFFYVWGAGISVSARATGQNLANPAEQDVNAVIQAFVDDDTNKTVLTGPTGHAALERALGTNGNVFLSCWTSPMTGRVQVRTIPFFEVQDVIANPDDRADPWYYKRIWTRTTTDTSTGVDTSEQITTYHPALGYWPASRPKAIGGNEVIWDAPVLHVKADCPEGWKFGIPDSYAAIDWARAYKDFLEDWATLVRALSRFAWRATAKGAKQAQVRRALSAAPSTDALTGQPLQAGGAAVMSPDMMLEAIPKTGATIDSDSGRPLAAMVAAALDVPVTMLLGDPGTTGARATAETLDRPTELMAEARRAVWTGAWQRLLHYVIDQAALAPRGPLTGTVTRDGDRLVVTLAGDTNDTVEVTWPDIDDDVSVDVLVKAIAIADQTDKLPPLVVARLLLQALGVDDPDEVLADLVDDQGNFVDPSVNAGQAAVDAFNRGADPATVAGDTTTP